MSHQDAEDAWRRRGLIWAPAGDLDWSRSHAQIPTVTPERAGLRRIYLGTRDSTQRTTTTWIDVDAADPGRVLAVAEEPALGLGALGTFDDSGAMPSWVIDVGDERRLYYIGWNIGSTVPYRNAIGLAIETGNGTFERVGEGPILDRGLHAPHFCTTPCVLVDGGEFRMWYSSCQRWRMIDGRPEAIYDIRHARSSDGVLWDRDEDLCIRASEDEVFTRPSVVRDGRSYRMWFCRRSLCGYRQRRGAGFRIECATSDDGLEWRRCQELDLPPGVDGWALQQTAYPWVERADGSWRMFYNGDGFGRDGFGWAETAAS